jgi:hypothetical protein
VERPVTIAAIRLQGVKGGDFEVYWGEHQLMLGQRALRHITDFRLMLVGDSLFVVPNLPLEADEATLLLDPRLTITPQFQATLLRPRLGLRNPVRRRMSEADWRIPWTATSKADQKCAGEPLRTDAYPGSDGEFINSAYVALLGRLPDADGFTHSCNALVSGRLRRDEIIQAILDSAEYKGKRK